MNKFSKVAGYNQYNKNQLNFYILAKVRKLKILNVIYNNQVLMNKSDERSTRPLC